MKKKIRTLLVETKLSEDGNAQGALDQILEELGDIVQLVRGDLSKLNRRTLGALTTIDVHGRDVVQMLVDKGIKAPTEFDWMAQLR